jgi:hypothetical protein
VIAARGAAADDPFELRRLCGTAAALLLAATASGCTHAHDPLAHSCGAADQRFLERATLDVTALGVWAQDYRAGDLGANEVAREAFDAAVRVTHVQPNDPSLRKAQLYLDGMFTEYGKAVMLSAKGRNAGDRMYRAYSLANYAHDVLAEAQPALQRQGCDVAPLL